MFRKDSPIVPDKKHINIILMNGGVGDHVGGSLIAVDYIMKRYPWLTCMIWVPDFLKEFAKHVLPKAALVYNYSEMKRKYNPEFVTLTTKWDGRFSPMKMHHTDYAFHVLCDERVEDADKNYLKVDIDAISLDGFSLPSRYVVFCVGYTAPVREFDSATVNALTAYVKGKGYTPVFLGSTEAKTIEKEASGFKIEGKFNQDVDYEAGLNLINKTSLLEATAIMGKAEAVIGVDCGLLHLAACTDADIVAGYTTVTPGLRAPVRHNTPGWNWHPVEPDSTLGCRFCQVKTNFLYGHDYKFCLYKDYACVKQLTAEKFITELEVIL